MLTARGLLLFYAFMLIVQVPLFIVSRVWQDVVLEIRHEETTGHTLAASGGGDPLYAAWFEFELDEGEKYEKLSFTSDADRLPSHGDEVVVQYFRARPQISRIAGMRCGVKTFWSWILPFLLTLPMPPVVDVVLRLIQRRRALCESGVATTGTLLEPNRFEALFLRRRRSRLPGRYWALKCSFEDEQGRTRRAPARMRRTPFALEPGDEVTVIYDPKKPRRSIVVEALGLEFEAEAGGAA